MSFLALKIDETKSAYGFDFGLRKESDSKKEFLFTKLPTVSTDTKVRFRKLVDEWKRETGHQSLVSQRIQHPAYRSILKMGQSVVPWIIKEMEHQPDHWFYALMQLTGENPVPIDFTGTVEDAVDLWVQWEHSRYAT